jgi:hypothetical protein
MTVHIKAEDLAGHYDVTLYHVGVTYFTYDFQIPIHVVKDYALHYTTQYIAL